MRPTADLNSDESTASDPKLNPDVEAFAGIARRYCAWAEGPSGEPELEG
ncbi:MAG: hypothetical protein JOZ96_17445 [Acidobacteria bacterium]|nr:hypothetical protein [Acidobacteriota bacterium]